MTDKLTPERRSRNMAQIRSKNTNPEMVVRKLIHRIGYRFRLHRKELPGKPDLVFRARLAVIFVHGCYWHGHGCARGGTGAKSNQSYWKPKISGNKTRHDTVELQLVELGWRCLVIWECETRDVARLQEQIENFLNAHSVRS